MQKYTEGMFMWYLQQKDQLKTHPCQDGVLSHFPTRGRPRSPREFGRKNSMPSPVYFPGHQMPLGPARCLLLQDAQGYSDSSSDHIKLSPFTKMLKGPVDPDPWSPQALK